MENLQYILVRGIYSTIYTCMCHLQYCIYLYVSFTVQYIIVRVIYSTVYTCTWHLQIYLYVAFTVMNILVRGISFLSRISFTAHYLLTLIHSIQYICIMYSPEGISCSPLLDIWQKDIRSQTVYIYCATRLHSWNMLRILNSYTRSGSDYKFF